MDDALRMRTNGVIFEGGHLSSPWVPAEANMREIDGRWFYAIRTRDTPFHKAVGLKCATPWRSTPVFTYIKTLRNRAIEDAAGEIEKEDNGTDLLDDGKKKTPQWERCTAVPSVLHIDIPQMECEGKVVPAHSMQVASTSNYGSVVEFELTAANVAYFYDALAAAPSSYFNCEEAMPRNRRRCFTLKPMYSDTPDVVERSSADGYTHPMAVTSYIDSSGRRRQHSQRLRVMDEHRQLGTAEEKRREVALSVQRFRDEHHYDDAEED